MGKKCLNCHEYKTEFVDEGFDDENEYYEYKYRCLVCGCVFVEQYTPEFVKNRIIDYTKE